GALTAGEAQGSRWSHVLWNCVGGGTHELRPDVYKASLQLEDTLLLCTDGLTKHLNDQDISGLLGKQRSAEETCRGLVAPANAAGGSDNVTVVVAHFRDARRAISQAGAQAAAETVPHKAAAEEVPLRAAGVPA